jgi:hypothetical protein
MGVKMQHTCAEIDYSSPNQATILPMPNELKVHGSKRYIKRYKEGSEEQVPVPKVGPEARPVLYIKHSRRIKFRVPRNHFSHNCQVAQSKACVVLPGVLLPTDKETEDQKQNIKQVRTFVYTHLHTSIYHVLSTQSPKHGWRRRATCRQHSEQSTTRSVQGKAHMDI